MDGAALFSAVDKVIAETSIDNLKELKDVKDYIAARSTNYPKLIAYIQKTIPEWTRLESAINHAYAQRVFILKRGNSRTIQD